MPPPLNPVSEFLRREVSRLATTWEAEVAKRVPSLSRLDRTALLDHMPEFLVGLAAWVEGDEERGRQGFELLAHGHALQRLGLGIDLQTLTSEYQVLRTVVLDGLLAVSSTDDVRASLVRLNAGLDHAVSQAIARYTGRRDELRERFVGILGHDLRNPLNAVTLAAAQITAQPCGDPRHARLAATIQRSADRMTRMITDVVDFAHAHLGAGIPSAPVETDMGALCEEAAAELRLAHPERELRVETAGDLRGHWDPDRVLQALSNLIGNAIQHGQDPIVISAHESPDRMAITTQIRNRGTPIPPDLLPHLFEPFRHGDAPPGRVRSSLGLGLYIVQQIALSHGAGCEVTSTDEATTFSITWPRLPLEVMSDRP